MALRSSTSCMHLRGRQMVNERPGLAPRQSRCERRILGAWSLRACELGEMADNFKVSAENKVSLQALAPLTGAHAQEWLTQINP